MRVSLSFTILLIFLGLQVLSLAKIYALTGGVHWAVGVGAFAALLGLTVASAFTGAGK